MPKVFLSYSEPDASKVKEIKTLLVDAKIEVYDFADHSLKSAIISDEVGENISSSDHVICFLSKNWIASPWCQQEWKIAFHENIDTVHEKLILIQLENLDPKVIPNTLAPLRRIAFNYSIEQGESLIELIKNVDSQIKTPPTLTPEKLDPINYIFVVGAPAAGKSTVSQLLAGHYFSRGISVRLENDYVYLQHLFRKEKAKGELKKFSESTDSEFLVIDPTVFDDVLYLIYKKMMRRPVRQGEVKIVEFSRKYYDASFLKYTINAMFNSVIIHMSTPLDVCTVRNLNRKEELNKYTVNDEAALHFDGDPNVHFTPPHVFEEYRKAEKIVSDQSLVLSLMPARAYVSIDNSYSLKSLNDTVSNLFDELLLSLVKKPESLEDYYKRRIGRLKAHFENSK